MSQQKRLLRNRDTKDQDQPTNIIQKKQKTSSNIPIDEFKAQVDALMLESRAIIEKRNLDSLKKEQLVEKQALSELKMKARFIISDEEIQDVLEFKLIQQLVVTRQRFIKDESQEREKKKPMIISSNQQGTKKINENIQSFRPYIDQIRQSLTVKQRITNKYGKLEADLASLKQAQLTPGRLTKRLKRKGDCQLQVAQEDLDKCSICYCSFDQQEVAALPCKHLFCLQCIVKLGEEYSNQCPLCRKKFTYVTKGLKMKDGDFIKKECIMIKVKRQVTHDEDASPLNENIGSSQIIPNSHNSFIDNDSDCEYCLIKCEDADETMRCVICQVHFSHSYCIPNSHRPSNYWICKFCKEIQ